jgi:ABC-type transport system involved in multi-copper enzyme maturation permease subunit
MIWLTWRQFRAQTIATAGFLLVLAGALVVTGLNLAHLYNSSGLAGCHAQCGTLASNFISQVKGNNADEKMYYFGIGVVYLAPAIIGIFWGAPLISREIEAGTFRLAWNQSVTRTRWLAVKLGLVGLAALVTAGLLSLMTNWWASPIYQAAAAASSDALSISRLAPLQFGASGIAPIGYAAFAFTLGVTAGVLIRRTVPAMAVTLAGFALVQLAWPAWVRQYLISPVRVSRPLNIAAINGVMISSNSQMTVTETFSKPGAWITSNQSVLPNGQPFTGPPTAACLHQGIRACNASIARLHLHQVITYQPASRFWQFQWYETAIFIALAVALAGFCAWWITHRRAT